MTPLYPCLKPNTGIEITIVKNGMSVTSRYRATDLTLPMVGVMQETAFKAGYSSSVILKEF